MADVAGHGGRITDEGIAKLRARIGRASPAAARGAPR